MIRRLALIAALAASQIAALPLEAPAGRPPVIDALLSLCAPYLGHPDQTLKAADAAGWAPASRKMVPPPSAEMTEGGYRFRSSRIAADYLYAGYGPSPIDGDEAKASLCALSESPANPALVLKALEAWIGVPPVEVDGDARYYAFIDDGNGHHPVSPDGPDYPRALKAGTMRFMIFAHDPDSVFIGMITPQPPAGG